jgi:hypothetical protein
MESSNTPTRSDANEASAIPRRLIAPLIVLLVTSIVYGAIYYREESIPTAIGANLVPAERVLKGEVPYRDFYKIQTPGILLLNAALFKFWGTSWITAATGVLIFKILTITMMFLTSRRVCSLKAAIVSVTLGVLWLAPGGPFRPAPIQYEMLFVMAAIYFVLRWLESGGGVQLFAAGLAVGMVAIFKQNVGVYAAIALMLSTALNTHNLPGSKEEKRPRAPLIKAQIFAALGIALPLAGLFLYLTSNGALGAAIDVFIHGPGEHIQSRFTGYALPGYSAIIFVVAVISVMVAARIVQRSPKLERLVLTLMILSAAICAAVVPQAAIDNSIYWFSPGLFAWAGWLYVRERVNASDAAQRERGVLLVLLLFALAAYGEVFPRSVRGLVIGALPPAFLLLGFLLDRKRSAGESRDDVSGTRRLAFVVATIVLLVFALRIELPEFFSIDRERGLRFKADTELNFDRGRGIYLPADRAAQVNALVDAIQSHVDEGGYFFAHALDASSYYFLADRNSPTGATLWNDTGTNDRERIRTMEALREKKVRLVLTSEQAMTAEPYQPLLDYLNDDFHFELAVGKTILLERNY